ICCMEGVLDKVMQMNPIRYHYKADKKERRKHIGFGAQEVKDIFPELVHYSEEKDLYSLNYGNLGAINTAAIQETNKRFDQQQKVVEMQAQKIKEQEEELKAIKSMLEELTAPTLEKVSKLWRSIFGE
ncbi:tail fiber domain-containing protein, partial [Xanthovirga aplysinae]|uniref:tail fiber domain-containing protein n=1 Tax=Xanthovirga aplysinae TaxID=2529853 RepID=UPI0012BB77C2